MIILLFITVPEMLCRIQKSFDLRFKIQIRLQNNPSNAEKLLKIAKICSVHETETVNRKKL